MNDFRAIVVGGGALGAAAAYWLARRGCRDVLVLEQHELGHSLGASGDHSRIIRRLYHDNAYGRLMEAAYENWRALDAEAGQHVFVQTGGVNFAVRGTAGHDSVEKYRRVMRDNDVPFEVLDATSAAARFPQWNVADLDVTVTYQPDSGLIDIRRATLTHLALARGLGATVLERTRAERIEPFDGGVRVHTDRGAHTADAVVVCAAAWADELLVPLGQTWRTTVTEEQVVYIQPPRLGPYSVEAFPVWGWHGDHLYYGFPTYGEPAIKLAREHLARPVTPARRSLEPYPEETEHLLDFVRERLPAAYGPVLYAKTCLYDMPPDRHFVIDRLPGQERVLVGNGAAHAGKLAGLIGRILAELVVDGRTAFPIEPFRADRAALLDPDARPELTLLSGADRPSAS